jgi:hypothetical protein
LGSVGPTSGELGDDAIRSIFSVEYIRNSCRSRRNSLVAV